MIVIGLKGVYFKFISMHADSIQNCAAGGRINMEIFYFY